MVAEIFVKKKILKHLMSLPFEDLSPRPPLRTCGEGEDRRCIRIGGEVKKQAFLSQGKI